MCKIIELLEQINKEHRVRFTSMSYEFDTSEHLPTILDFDVKESKINGTVYEIHWGETDDTTGYNLFQMKEYFKFWWNDEEITEIKFFFNNIEIIPTLGDIGHSDKITQIYFEPKK